jgi:hypothetical protein
MCPSATAQTGADNYTQLQTLLNRSKGKIFTNEYGSKHKIGKQTFAMNAASRIDEGPSKDEYSYAINYSEIDWKEMTWYFGNMKSGDQLQVLTIKLKRAARMERIVLDGNNKMESFTVELTFYLQKADKEKIQSLLDAIK